MQGAHDMEAEEKKEGKDQTRNNIFCFIAICAAIRIAPYLMTRTALQ
jgi:hypothetical protein